MENTALLKEMRLFQDIDALSMVQVNKQVVSHKFAAGDQVIESGGGPAGIYVVKSGEFEVSLVHEGVENVLATLVKGDTFGELSLIDGHQRSANVTCREAGELLELTRDAFQTLVGHSDKLKAQIYENLLGDLSGKIRGTNESIVQIVQLL